MRLTIACPAAHIADANQLAMVLGYSEADQDTYRDPQWQDAQGNLYSLASLPVGDTFVSTATGPLTRPEWDAEEIIDMGAAERAQALIVLWVPTEEDPDAPLASPNVITAVSGEDGVSMITAMGLVVVPQDGDTD